MLLTFLSSEMPFLPSLTKKSSKFTRLRLPRNLQKVRKYKSPLKTPLGNRPLFQSPFSIQSQL